MTNHFSKTNLPGPLTMAVAAALLSFPVLLGGCSRGSAENTGQEAAFSEEILKENPETVWSGGKKTEEENGKEIQKEAGEEFTEPSSIQLPALDFTIRNSPVDTDRYDISTDRIYKEAFLKAITNQIPIQWGDSGETVFYKDLLKDGEKLEETEFTKMIRQSDYFYLDYDGDGLPELIINTEGPCVLKFDPEKNGVILYARKEEGWNVLGTGQMYACFSELGDGFIKRTYCYELTDDELGCQEFYYQGQTCQVSVDGHKQPVEDEETVYGLYRDYIAAITNSPHPMSFLVFFGDGEDQGYFPGEEQPSRWWLEDTAPLPINEENGEEWEVYKAMMEGDFSLVEDERWGSLQSEYEDSLEKGNGRCGWSYFLMDFNQDGVKELVIRLYPDGVSNMASFRYENGHVKMWGSYASADWHGYQVPLVNGQILSVSWYQDTRDLWIKNLDSQCWEIKHRSYFKGKIKDDWDNGKRDDSDDSGEERDYYVFQDYYHDGRLCGSLVSLSEEQWEQIEDMIEKLYIPEEAWKPCAAFTPKSDRPEIPGVG